MSPAAGLCLTSPSPEDFGTDTEQTQKEKGSLVLGSAFHVCTLLLYFHGASSASRLLLLTTEVNQVLEQSSRLDLDPC